jgi:hypothetical protein
MNGVPTLKQSLSVTLKAALAILSSLLACIGCGGNRESSAPPLSPKIRWRGEDTDYRNVTQSEAKRGPDQPAAKSEEIQNP